MSAPPQAREEEEETVMSSVVKEFQALKEKFKSEDFEYSPFHGIEKNQVLQEAKMFNSSETVTRHPRRCRRVLTKLLYLILMGDHYSGSEASEVFFGVTKLFQSSNVDLRRMMYLFIKEVAESTSSEEVIIVVSSLTKDMNSSEDLYRGNAIRVLAKIIDSSMLGQIERYIKQAVVDKSPMVASSALVSGLQFAKHSPDIVRRWSSEIQDSCSSPHEMVQYHAILLLHTVRAHDKLAVSKMVSRMWRQSGVAAMATCQVIRYTVQLMSGKHLGGGVTAQACYAYLEACLRHKSDMVLFEAARAICTLPTVTETDLAPAVTVLQLLLTSPKPVLRFAAVRTLNGVAQRFPGAVVKCNEDLESMISDSNRSIATLAITTLLKTGSASSVDRLMGEISGFVSDLNDDFKRVVVRAVRELCSKYPDKHRMFFMFLTNLLREEGSFVLKNEIVDVFVDVMDKLPDVRDTAFFHLCELIEDCEYTKLSTRVLHYLAGAGPDSKIAPRIVRAISNRLILENTWIKAAALNALCSFGAALPELRGSILTLIRRCLADEDDEVRDRAALALEQLADEQRAPQLGPAHTAQAVPGGVAALRRSLLAFRDRPSPGRVCFSKLPYVEPPEESPTKGDEGSDEEDAARGGAGAAKGGAAASAAAAAAAGGGGDGSAESGSEALRALYAVPEFAGVGQQLTSGRAAYLTEHETEYVVACTKHIFSEHVILRFAIVNTLDDQELRNVRVAVEPSDDDGAFAIQDVIPAAVAAFNKPATAYVCLRRSPDAGFPTVTLNCELKFDTYSVDPSSGEADDEGVSDEYPLEPVALTPADFVRPSPFPDPKASWEQLGAEGEVTEKFVLSFPSIADAVEGVVKHLGMVPLLGTGVVPDDATAHRLILSGSFLGEHDVVARAQLQKASAESVVLMIKLRSSNRDLSQLLADCLG